MICPYCGSKMINTYSDSFENYGYDGNGEIQIYTCLNDNCQCESEFIKRE